MQTSVPISGLTYLPDFVEAEEEAALLAQIDAAVWRHDLKRRVQHYGYRYDYRARTVTPADRLGDLPGWLAPLADRLWDAGWFARRPDQVIVNEYQPGQGISAHIDCAPCFGGTIASLSLGSPAIMRFTRPGNAPVDLPLPARSLVVLSGEARYDWRHAIPARRSDPGSHGRIPRTRRVSLTFRTVIV
jgi:alkylated DNA repair dioxygenase AlkB